jgi:hypothetical protein
VNAGRIGVLLILPLTGGAARAVAQSAETFAGDIVLGRPTDRSVTVSVLFPADQDVVSLEYGERSGSLTGRTLPQANIRAGVPYVEVVGGLEPNRRYYCSS